MHVHDAFVGFEDRAFTSLFFFPIFVKVRGFEGAPKLVAAAAHFLLQLQLAASHPPSPTPAHFQQLPILCLLFVYNLSAPPSKSGTHV